ncbi:MAG: membrane-bound lytic murein transglycosylase MltF [Gammaproteobacteria bacterium]|jgi:membrane-bound lytic murein transglycosylase F
MRLLAIIVLGLFLVTCSPPLTQLQQVERDGVLRVVTRNAPTTYYIGAEGPVGPEYELATGFAEFLGVDLEIYTVDSLAQVLPEVIAGRAQLAAAGLTVTPAREQEVSFGPVYRRVTQQLVYRRGSWRPRDLEQLVGGRLEVVAGSSYVDTLEELRLTLPGLTWLENPTAETQELLAEVANGTIDYTVADSTAVLVNRYFHPDIRTAMDISESQPIAWAFRAGDDRSLLDRAEAYFAEAAANGRIAEIMERYYGHTDRFDYVGSRTFLRHVESRLPQYEAWFREAAVEHGFDWRLLAALAYQESHWNPRAVSPTGVRGLMMLTRDTAAAMGVADRNDPEQSIRGGAAYLRRVIGKIPERIPEPDRTWMALAGYNVGFGHLEDARRITETRGLDPDRWAHVRDSLPLLTQERWYQRVRFGYARGWEPVRYVDNIRRYLEILSWITAETTVSRRSPPSAAALEEASE